MSHNRIDNEQARPERSVMPAQEEEKPLEIITPEVAEVIKELPKAKQQIIIKTIEAMKSESFAGPLPHPRILNGYEAAKSGFAERIDFIIC